MMQPVPSQQALPTFFLGFIGAMAAAAAFAVWNRFRHLFAPALAMATTSGSKYTTVEQQASYGIGLQLGSELWKGGSFDGLDVEAMKDGLADGFTKSELKVDPDTLQAAFQTIQARIKENAVKKQAAGLEFLKANGERPEVTTTASGLQYEVLEEGTGATPTPEDVVTVNYEGKLVDGTVFDSSYARGEPTEFPANRVIKGWTEALCMMKVGAKWNIWLPSELAYGEKGIGELIGPNEVLTFKVELLGVSN
jgi:FKBP-type peptidyl-prolyl cis-trans isomerase FklB